MDVKDFFIIGLMGSLVASAIFILIYSNKVSYLSARVRYLQNQRDADRDIIKRMQRRISEARTTEEIVRETLRVQKEWPEGEAKPVQKPDEDRMNYQVRLNSFALQQVNRGMMTVDEAGEVLRSLTYVSEV